MTNSEQGDPPPLWRRLLISPAVVWGVWVAVLIAHLWWLCVSMDPVIVQRFGAFTIIIGILMAARPYLRNGPEKVTQAAIPRPPGLFPVKSEDIALYRERVAKEAPEVQKDVLAERRNGVLMVGMGTLINGYGDVVAKWLLGQV